MTDYYLFTFRPQITEQELFEDFFTILEPAIQNSKTIIHYSYNVEEDNSLKKHLHLLAGFKTTKSKNNPLSQFFNGKIFKEFKSMLKYKQTNEPAGFDDRKVKDTDEDFLKVLGYVNKELCSRGKTTWSTQEIEKAYKYYYATERIKKEDIKKSDWKVLTTKNCYVLIEDFITRNNITEVNPAELKIQMLHEKYGFANFSKPKQIQIFNEIAIALFHDKQKEQIEKEFEDDQKVIENLQAKNNVYQAKDYRQQLKIAELQKELEAYKSMLPNYQYHSYSNVLIQE